jgi:integrase
VSLTASQATRRGESRYLIHSWATLDGVSPLLTDAPADPMNALLPALIADDPDERVVTDTLLDQLDLSIRLDQMIDGLVALLEAATTPRTRRAYESDFTHFATWAHAHRLEALPALPQTVALYISAYQHDLRPASLLRRLSAIAVKHRAAGHPTPTTHELVRRAVAGLRRTHGVRPAGKAALVTAQLSIICTHLQARTRPPAVAGLPARQAARLRHTAAAAALRARRDRALLLLGYAAALRRSELVALNVGDLTDDRHGLSVFIKRSKTDQEGLGDIVGVAHGHPLDTCGPTCPISAWREWRDAMADAVGIGPDELSPDSPAFRPITRHGTLGTPTDADPNARLTGQSVALAVKAAVTLLGDDTRFPAARYAGHSLRAGFATQAAAAGVPLDRIMRQTRHHSVAIALRYIREADVWTNNASAALGL